MNAAMLQEQKTKKSNKSTDQLSYVRAHSRPQTYLPYVTQLKIITARVHYPHNHHDQGSDRASKVQLHWILNLFSIVAAAGGFGAIYLNKEVITIINIVVIIVNIIIINIPKTVIKR